MDDEALMCAYARGDGKAFDRLYEKHRTGLFRFVRRLLGGAASGHVEEVFQDTWLRVVQSREGWAPQGATFRTWLFTLAHHRAVDLLRRRGYEVVANGGGDEVGSGDEPEFPSMLSAPRADVVVFWRQAGQQLLHCVDQLSPTQRNVFMLHFDEGLSLAEAACVLDVGFETAKARLRYAMGKLRTCMEPYVIGPHLGMPSIRDPGSGLLPGLLFRMWVHSALEHARGGDDNPSAALSEAIFRGAHASNGTGHEG
jgi:RNA polymerase sigma factor (sigma-70 family)